MSAFVIDASTVAPLAFWDEAERLTDADRRLIAEADLHAPAHWPFEIGNMLLMAQRRGRLRDEERVRVIACLRDLDVMLDAESQTRALADSLDMAVSDGLTLYDAAYLELARRNGHGLLTLDGALSRAARARGIEAPLRP